MYTCYMQKTIILDDGQYGHQKARMKLMVRGINVGSWKAMKIGCMDTCEDQVGSLPQLQQGEEAEVEKDDTRSYSRGSSMIASELDTICMKKHRGVYVM